MITSIKTNIIGDIILPFEELQLILSRHILERNDSNLLHTLSQEINTFVIKICNNYNITNYEKNYVILYHDIVNNTLDIKSANLFTACLMFGIYVPLYLTQKPLSGDDLDEYSFDEGRIYIDNNVFIYEKY